MNTRQMAGMLVAALVAGGTAAYAQREGPPPDMQPGDGGPGMRQDGGMNMPPPMPPRDMRQGGQRQDRMMGGRQGQGPQGGPGKLPDPESLRKAGASDQQIKTLEEFMLNQQTKSIDLRAAAEKADIALGRLMRAENPDEKAVMQAVDALNQARGEMIKADFAARLKMKQVLGEEIMRKLHEQKRPGPMDGPGNAPRCGAPDRDQDSNVPPPPPGQLR